MTNKPIFIGIAGDSASGKHTFYGFIHDILGEENISIVNGDDYHRWPRKHPKWDEYTHLHPDGNDLELLLRHARSLLNGETISKCIYDHEKGEFINWEEIRSKKFIAFVGLHTFYLEAMRELMDLCLYMSPREDVRRYWKVRRDQIRGGYTEEEILQSIRRRLRDGKKFVHPQQKHAHLVIHYYSPRRISRRLDDQDIELRVKFFQKDGTDLSAILEALSRCPTLKISRTNASNPAEHLIDVRGTISAEQIEEIAESYFASYLPIVSEGKKWKSNTQGVCQLMFLENLCRLKALQPKPEDDRELSLRPV